MLLLAFVAFVILVLAWMVAPNGEIREAAVAAAPAATPAPNLGEPATA